MADDKFLLKPGESIGSFRIVSELGRGNNGIVYLAEQNFLDREVALKLLLPEVSGDKQYVELLMREARAAARLNHPNIVQALDAGCDNGRYYFAMEYIRGRTLEDVRLNSPEEISLNFLVDISIELADALDYAWEKFSMTHGDIKPENLMICDDGRMLKLADLGLAHVSGRSGMDDDSIMATPMYVSPEVVSGNGEIGVCSDIYSFGVMFYELVAGKPPFRGDTEELLRCHLEVPPPPLEEANPDVPRELAAFTMRMLEKNSGDRPGSWREVKDFLEEFKRRQSVRGTVPLPRLPPRPANRGGAAKNPWLWIGVGLGTLIVLTAAVLFLLSARISRGI